MKLLEKAKEETEGLHLLRELLAKLGNGSDLEKHHLRSIGTEVFLVDLWILDLLNCELKSFDPLFLLSE